MDLPAPNWTSYSAVSFVNARSCRTITSPGLGDARHRRVASDQGGASGMGRGFAKLFLVVFSEMAVIGYADLDHDLLYGPTCLLQQFSSSLQPQNLYMLGKRNTCFFLDDVLQAACGEVQLVCQGSESGCACRS